ncbi:MAG: molecular chaperone HtpG [Akkermansiaceae bacterium]|nr:molecular chaperone HtpG [Akkermansiaceae bacterium]
MENQAFQTEVRQLLDIVIHAFYSDREVFVRELVSNASDALEKLRLKQLTESAIYQPERELRLTITTDEENHTLTIADAGIGMTRDEVVEYLGTIAHSGTKKFLELMQETKGGTQDLIGQFGVGFYSVFMAADEVEVTTRSWDPEAAPVRWVSDGKEGYSLGEAPADTPRGTCIHIKLKEDAAEFSQENRVRYIVGKYSNFIGFPIDFNGEHLNTVQAIWMKNKKDVSPEEYEGFYKFISHTEAAPLSYMHFSAEAPIVLNSVLFVPEENPESMGFGRCEPNVALYCHKVLIDSKPENLLPEWLRFLSGVVDSEDLPLNISREMLQDNSLLRKISSIITKRFIKHLEELAKSHPETYEKFWKQFSRFIKEGIVTSWEHKEELGKLLRFESTFTEEGKLTSFADYISRMKENQKDVYVLFGESRAQLEHSPYLDALKARGFEVAFFTDGGDQFVIDSLMRVQEKEIKPISRANLDLPPLETQTDLPGLDEGRAKSLTDWVMEAFQGRFGKVTTGERVSSAPAIALQSAADISPDVKAYLKAMGQAVPEAHPEIEFNPHHPLVQKLADLQVQDADTAKLLAGQIIDTALLRAGMLDDPSRLADQTQQLLEKLLQA